LRRYAPGNIGFDDVIEEPTADAAVNVCGAARGRSLLSYPDNLNNLIT
jgi:hypothetical protein